MVDNLVTYNNLEEQKSQLFPVTRYWLLKFAPYRTSWGQILIANHFAPRGIKNFQARKYLKEMKLGDLCLFYHSQEDKAIMGVLEVVQEAYPDPTTTDTRWVTCDFRPVKSLTEPVSIEFLRQEAQDKAFIRDLPLLRQPRLTVMPVSQDFFDYIVERG